MSDQVEHGSVTITAGTPVVFSLPHGAKTVWFQTLSTNAGNCAIGSSTVDAGSGTQNAPVLAAGRDVTMDLSTGQMVWADGTHTGDKVYYLVLR